MGKMARNWIDDNLTILAQVWAPKTMNRTICQLVWRIWCRIIVGDMGGQCAPVPNLKQNPVFGVYSQIFGRAVVESWSQSSCIRFAIAAAANSAERVLPAKREDVG